MPGTDPARTAGEKKRNPAAAQLGNSPPAENAPAPDREQELEKAYRRDAGVPLEEQTLSQEPQNRAEQLRGVSNRDDPDHPRKHVQSKPHRED